MLTNAPSSVFSPFGRKSTFSTGGEKAFGSALPSNAPRSAGFSLGWRSCHQARRAQMTDEGGGLLYKNGLVMVITFPSSVVFALRLSRHLPPREGFWLAASQRGSNGKAFGWPLSIKQRAAQAQASPLGGEAVIKPAGRR